jgi:hypothetical protein
MEGDLMSTVTGPAIAELMLISKMTSHMESSLGGLQRCFQIRPICTVFGC